MGSPFAPFANLTQAANFQCWANFSWQLKPSGMPYGTVNLRHGVPAGETPITCTAGVGTFVVEFGQFSVVFDGLIKKSYSGKVLLTLDQVKPNHFQALRLWLTLRTTLSPIFKFSTFYIVTFIVMPPCLRSPTWRQIFKSFCSASFLKKWVCFYSWKCVSCIPC